MCADIGTNLVGDLLTEMQQNNPPGIFNTDGNPSYQPNTGVQNQSTNQEQQINPQLQQQFMFVLQQDPNIKQQFSDPQALQTALQNTNVMMNTIAFYNQNMNQTMPQMPQKPDIDDNEDEIGDENDEIQTDEDTEIDDINLLTTQHTWLDLIVGNLKETLIIALIFEITLLPVTQQYILSFVSNVIYRFIPRLQQISIIPHIILSIVFFVSVLVVKILLQ